jgi:hypothetical protein
MENSECRLPTISECPSCKTAVRVEDFNGGKCPNCTKTYKWVPVGTENHEWNDGPHDYISWF